MKNIFDTVYRQDYLDGYSNGLNPLVKIKIKKNNKAFNDGFNAGRFDFESINGSITDGIPRRIITKKILEEFLMAGLLGLNTDTDGYTSYQLSVLVKWYQSGIEKYNPDQSNYLFEILEQNGIQIS